MEVYPAFFLASSLALAMVPALSDRPDSPELPFFERRKVLISVLLGLAGFAGAFWSLRFSRPPFTLSITWSFFLPYLAALAYGGRYGLVAGTLGLAGIAPLFIWPDNGWASVVSAILYISGYSWQGWCASRQRIKPALWNNPFVAYLPWALIYILGTRFLYPPAFDFNPPFWFPEAARAMPVVVLNGIVTKGGIVVFVNLLFAEFILRTPIVRKLLGIPVPPETRRNSWIVLGSLAGAVGAWGIFLIFNRIYVDLSFPRGILPIKEPREIIALFVCLAMSFLVGSMICRTVEALLRDEHMLRTHAATLATQAEELRVQQQRLEAINENPLVGITTLDAAGYFTGANRTALALYGYSLAELKSLSAMELTHPEDREASQEMMSGLFQGKLLEYRLEKRLVHKDASVVWVELFVAPLLDQDGRVGASYGFLMDISARKEAEASMRQALEEKSLLLRELYHRTKNNMGLIIGMLNLQSGQVDDPYLQEAFEDAENRIRSMAMVHQELYENQDLSHINLQSYTSKLVSSLITGLDLHGAKIRLKSYLEDIEVPIDVAIPCGLILNELVTNSLKHAFPGDREGELKVSISKLEDHSIEIIIGDDGIGFPAGFDPRKDGNVGLQTVIALAEGQLQGRIEYCDTESPAGNEAGTRKGEARNPAWRITLPDRHYHPRV